MCENVTSIRSQTPTCTRASTVQTGTLVLHVLDEYSSTGGVVSVYVGAGWWFSACGVVEQNGGSEESGWKQDAKQSDKAGHWCLIEANDGISVRRRRRHALL